MEERGLQEPRLYRGLAIWGLGKPQSSDPAAVFPGPVTLQNGRHPPDRSARPRKAGTAIPTWQGYVKVC